MNICTSAVADMMMSFKFLNLLSESRRTVRRKSEKRSRSWTWRVLKQKDFKDQKSKLLNRIIQRINRFPNYLVDDDVRQGAEGASVPSHERPEENPVRAKRQKGARGEPRLQADLVADDLTNLKQNK